MTIAVWDTDLPADLLQQGYSESTSSVLLRSAMDVGPAKVRQRATRAIRSVKGSQLMTTAQIAELKTFFNTTLENGSLRFSWTSPVDGSSVEMRFVEPPSWSVASGDYYNVNLDLEILP